MIEITSRVFIGVEGGLLLSDDGGKSFKFVIDTPLGDEGLGEHPVAFRTAADEVKGYPYVWRIVTPADQPNVVVVAGFEKNLHRPYLAWSNDGGDTWINLSDRLPGYAAQETGQVTSLVAAGPGEVLITVNETLDSKGHLMRVTLGK